MGRLPDKPLFLALLGTWLLFFQFLGNSTLGYVDTHSLYAWMSYTTAPQGRRAGLHHPTDCTGVVLLETRRVTGRAQAHVVAGVGAGGACVGDPPDRICHPTSPGFDRRFLLWHIRLDRIGLGSELAAS